MVICDRVEPAASPPMSAMPPKAEVNPEHSSPSAGNSEAYFRVTVAKPRPASSGGFTSARRETDIPAPVLRVAAPQRRRAQQVSTTR